MPKLFIKELMVQDAKIVLFLLKIIKKYLEDQGMSVSVENFTYQNYLKAKQAYLKNNNLLSSNYFNTDDDANKQFQEASCVIDNALNTQAIIRARKNDQYYKNGRIVALNLANANQPLGAATASRHGSQEEYFGHNSSLFLDIYSGLNDETAKNAILAIYFNLFIQDNCKFKKADQIGERNWKNAHKAVRLICKQANYSLHGDTAFLHSNVIFFDAGLHDIDGRNYHQIPHKPFDPDIIHQLVIADIVSVAALNLNRLTRDPDTRIIGDEPQQIKITQEKIEACLIAANHKTANFLILGALGCGAFKNPIDRVANLFASSMLRLDVTTPALFAIFGNDKTGTENRDVFTRVMDARSEYKEKIYQMKLGAEKLKQSGLAPADQETLNTLIEQFESIALFPSRASSGTDIMPHLKQARVVAEAIVATCNFKTCQNLWTNICLSSALKTLHDEASPLTKTPNYARRGVLMMALGAALAILGGLAVLAGLFLVPTGVGSALGIAAVAAGSACSAIGIGLFAGGALTHKYNQKLTRDYTAKNNARGEALMAVHTLLRNT